MNETYYVVKQNAEGCYLLSKPNQIMFTSKDKREAMQAFAYMTDGRRVYPREFDKGIYVLLSIGHYHYHPKALYVIDTNTYPV